MIITSKRFLPVHRIHSMEDWTQYGLAEDGLSSNRKLHDCSKTLEENYNYIRNHSKNQDKKALDEFDYILRDYWQIPMTHSVFREPYVTYTPVSRHRRPISVVETTPYFDINDLPTKSLKAHPKVKVEIISTNEVSREPETDVEYRKRIIEERLDKILGYRAPRYKLSRETRDKISNLQTIQIRKLFPNITFEKDSTSKPKKVFINSKRDL